MVLASKTKIYIVLEYADWASFLPLSTKSMASSEAKSNNFTKTISKLSLRSLVANFKAKFCFSRPNPIENVIQNDASSNAATHKNDHHGEALPPSSEMIPDDIVLVESALSNYTDHMNLQINLAREKFKELQSLGSSDRDFEELRKAIAKLKLQIPTPVNILSTTSTDDHHGGAVLSPSSKLMHKDLLLVDSTFAKTKEFMDHLSVKINQAHEKFKELQILRIRPGRELDHTLKQKRDFYELRKAIQKLKVQVPTHRKIRSADSDRHHNQWPNINEADDAMTHFFHKEPEVAGTSDFHGPSRDADALNHPIMRLCLFCFFKFPTAAIIKRTTMIYLWIGLGYTSFLFGQDTSEYDDGNKIFDRLVESGFIEPIKQNCSLVPDSCRMSPSVRSALHEGDEYLRFTSHDNLDLDLGFFQGHQLGRSCLINIGEAIINWEPELFVNVDYIRCVYLGRWQNLATHHIELADAKILDGLKNQKRLKFLSLRGISMITELPKSILELESLNILDIRTCHNLEAIPEEIGFLKHLTHLDMSECYFLEHMPKSLARLSKLEVLKGFFIGEVNEKKQSCTLSDLSRLPRLRKLNIYVSVKDFQRLWDFNDLKNFEVLQKLTISWGGCSLQGESRRQSQGKASMKQLSLPRPVTLPPKLQKLDLQCFPSEGLIDWLSPARIEGLKKLYIRGGQVSDLGQSREDQGERWNVEILRLKYLSKLEVDWSKMSILFPNLIYLHQEDCPRLRNFPCDTNGVWMDKDAPYVQEQLRKYSRTCDIASSSMAESCPTIDRDDCNICPVNE